jgi:hypothetical protein
MLLWLSKASGLSYNEVNVIAYYFLAPLVFLLLIDRIRGRFIFTPCFIVAWGALLVLVPRFSEFADWVFYRSVDVLDWFSWMGWNYTVASVIICVVLPGVVFLVLLYYAFPKLFGRHTSEASD